MRAATAAALPRKLHHAARTAYCQASKLTELQQRHTTGSAPWGAGAWKPAAAWVSSSAAPIAVSGAGSEGASSSRGSRLRCQATGLQKSITRYWQPINIQVTNCMQWMQGQA